MPRQSDTRISRQTIFRISRVWTSFSASPRMMLAEVCAPALPLVSISMGMQVTSIGMATKAASKFCRIFPETVAEIIRIISQGRRFFTVSKMPILR